MKIRYIIFSFLPLILLFSLSEIILRLCDFKYSDTPLVLQLAPRSMAEDVSSKTHKQFKIEQPLIKDKLQFWIPENDPFKNKSLVQKKPGVTRIVTLGCSCTQVCFYTEETYPSILEKMLNESGNAKYEVLNAGVGAYSSYQGLQRLKHAVLNYKPDIITVFFGWNDHWVAQKPDKEVRIRSDLSIKFLNFVERFRTFQALNQLTSFLMKWITPSKSKSAGQLMPRVQPEDYEANLKEIIRIARENDAQPVLATAPSNPSQFTTSWVWPFPAAQLIATHLTYNQIVRKVAREATVPLVDLDLAIKNIMATRNQQAAPLFSDAIHFTPVGCEIVAKIFYLTLHKLNRVVGNASPAH